MSGMEIPAVAAVAKAGDAVGKVLAGSEAEKKAILEIAKDSPGALVAGEAMGDRMAVKQLAINKLLAPLFWFTGYRREYFESGAFAEDLSAKMRDVPEEEMVSPAPNVAAQALEGLSYSLDEPDLKEMYLNLLSTASDARRAGSAHPSYAGVIRQLSAPEAKLLPLFLADRNGTPAAEVRLVAKDQTMGFRTIERHLVNLRHNNGQDSPSIVEEFSIFVDNWARLGLVTADYSVHRVGEHTYDWVEQRPEYLRHLGDDDAYDVGFEKGLIIPTDFGLRFGRAVLPAQDGPIVQGA